MTLLALGLNHKTAPIDIRERVSFGPDIVVGALRSLAEHAGAGEAVIVSTCNRTEIYCAGDALDGDALQRWLSRFHGLDAALVRPYVYSYRDKEAVCHLFEVAAGLDSMILGEPQILGQVKSAFQTAQNSGAIGKLLGRLFQCTFALAKQVRTDTAIGNSPVSVAFAAVTLARQIFADLSAQTALLIGAGETIELAARHLHQHGLGRMVVANRTVERAHGLAAQFDGYAIALTEIAAHLPEADIVISSTAATHHVVTKDRVAQAMRGRRGDPLFLIDIAVPRDIDPAVNDLSDVFLYDIDDLNGVVEANLEERMREAQRAEVIIEEEMAEFERWLESMEVVPTVAAIRAKAEMVRQAELEKALKRLGGLSEKELQTIEALSSAIVNKMLHGPTERLKRVSSEKDGYTYVEAARFLYGLDVNPEGKSPHVGLIRSILGRSEKPAEASTKEMGDTLGC